MLADESSRAQGPRNATGTEASTTGRNSVLLLLLYFCLPIINLRMKEHAFLVSGFNHLVSLNISRSPFLISSSFVFNLKKFCL